MLSQLYSSLIFDGMGFAPSSSTSGKGVKLVGILSMVHGLVKQLVFGYGQNTQAN